MNGAQEYQSRTNPKMSTRLLASQTMMSNHYTAVIIRKISQDTRKRKDMLKNKNIPNRKKNMTTNKTLIVNQTMRLQPIRNLMTRKDSLPEIISQLKMLKNGTARWSIRLPN